MDRGHQRGTPNEGAVPPAGSGATECCEACRNDGSSGDSCSDLETAGRMYEDAAVDQEVSHECKEKAGRDYRSAHCTWKKAVTCGACEKGRVPGGEKDREEYEKARGEYSEAQAKIAKARSKWRANTTCKACSSGTVTTPKTQEMHAERVVLFGKYRKESDAHEAAASKREASLDSYNRVRAGHSERAALYYERKQAKAEAAK